MLRRFWLIAVVVVACSACAVSEKSSSAILKKNLSEPFQMTASFPISETEAEVLITKTTPEDYAVKFLSPESLCGLEVAKKGELVTFSFCGIICNAYFGDLLPENIIKCISLLGKIVSAPENTTRVGGYDQLGFCGVTVSAVNGIPVYIDFGGYSIKITSFERAFS